MRSTEAKRQHLNTFMVDIAGQLEQCEIALSENQQEMIARLATKYVDALEQSIWNRFPTEINNKLEAFHIFHAGMVPEEESEDLRSLATRKSKFSRTITTRTTLKRPKVSETNGMILNMKWVH